MLSRAVLDEISPRGEGSVSSLWRSTLPLSVRAPIISAAARNEVPAVYYQSTFARDGGLLSYGVDTVDTFRRAASYVDRILRGAKPGDLPVQFPTKFEMVVNRRPPRRLALPYPHRSCCAPKCEPIPYSNTFPSTLVV